MKITGKRRQFFLRFGVPGSGGVESGRCGLRLAACLASGTFRVCGLLLFVLGSCLGTEAQSGAQKEGCATEERQDARREDAAYANAIFLPGRRGIRREQQDLRRRGFPRATYGSSPPGDP